MLDVVLAFIDLSHEETLADTRLITVLHYLGLIFGFTGITAAFGNITWFIGLAILVSSLLSIIIVTIYYKEISKLDSEIANNLKNVD